MLNALVALRVIPPPLDRSQDEFNATDGQGSIHDGKSKFFTWKKFPMNFITAPLIADLFLLAILAIGRDEVYGGTIGSNNISPIDIMAFFITLAYIAISIDASGLIRFLAFKVLQKGGKFGHRLFFYLYAFFFCLGSFIGNDPIILSGTAFLAYMTRVSSNIIHPRAWIFAQFAVANIASAILVSSNPTNLVLAGAFDIRFIEYTANMIVPVVITAIVLFPFLLYIVFADESLIPLSIQMHELSEEAKARKPVNPNIPNARGNAEEQENDPTNSEQSKLLSLEEIMNPFLDKGGAGFGALVMAATLITLLALNAASQSTGEHPVFYVTLPAAVVMFCWDIAFGWIHRDETRKVARDGRREVERARQERAEQLAKEAEELERTTSSLVQAEEDRRDIATTRTDATQMDMKSHDQSNNSGVGNAHRGLLDGNTEDNTTPGSDRVSTRSVDGDEARDIRPSTSAKSTLHEKQGIIPAGPHQLSGGVLQGVAVNRDPAEKSQMTCERDTDPEKQHPYDVAADAKRGEATLVSLVADTYRWSQETFPTATAVLNHLPFALVPFAFSMFILVQALVTKGWVPVFAYGWDHWVTKTGTVGSVGGMGFLSVILCNVSLIYIPRYLLGTYLYANCWSANVK